MQGIFEVTVRNNRVQYRFTIHRNITILRGNSATGKTTLIDMIAQYARSGIKSGIQLSCDRACIVLTEDHWQQRMAEMAASLIFIDEDSDFIRTEEFAALARQSDCYYIIVTRATLSNLPYSVDEIYELRNVTRGYGGIHRLYTEFHRIYTAPFRSPSATEAASPDLVVVEDSHAGYEFFHAIFAERGITCIAAGGNSNIPSIISMQPAGSNILIIADGAAYGAYMERTLALCRTRNVALFLPESFEWMILSSGLIAGRETREMLDNPAEHIESRQYFSWEQFFTAYLIEHTRDSYLQYQKSKLNPVYLQENERNAIMQQMPELIL